jgi:hypothetical protein
VLEVGLAEVPDRARVAVVLGVARGEVEVGDGLGAGCRGGLGGRIEALFQLAEGREVDVRGARLVSARRLLQALSEDLSEVVEGEEDAQADVSSMKPRNFARRPVWGSRDEEVRLSRSVYSGADGVVCRR